MLFFRSDTHRCHSQSCPGLLLVHNKWPQAKWLITMTFVLLMNLRFGQGLVWTSYFCSFGVSWRGSKSEGHRLLASSPPSPTGWCLLLHHLRLKPGHPCLDFPHGREALVCGATKHNDCVPSVSVPRGWGRSCVLLWFGLTNFTSSPRWTGENQESTAWCGRTTSHCKTVWNGTYWGGGLDNTSGQNSVGEH